MLLFGLGWLLFGKAQVSAQPFHAADFNHDAIIDQYELKRVIELYDCRSGSVRTGAYHAQSGTVDGYSLGPGARTGTPHSADVNGDWAIGLRELTRVIELANYPTPAARTGRYHAQSGTEDGFAPGPAPVDLPMPELVLIQAGSFLMGSPSGESGRDADEEPRTQVTLTRSFWLGKYEVTQAQFEAVMGRNPSYFPGHPDHPVEQVSWVEAEDFCARLTAQERRKGQLPAGYVYRLPTEAEWEYACRADTATRFSFGEDPDYALLGAYGWTWSISEVTTYPVGAKRASRWGLHDIYGNVWEWCSDWYGPYPGGSVTDPTGPASGTVRVVRGGAWFYDAKEARSASRFYQDPAKGTVAIGFRIALAPEL